MTKKNFNGMKMKIKCQNLWCVDKGVFRGCLEFAKVCVVAFKDDGIKLDCDPILLFIGMVAHPYKFTKNIIKLTMDEFYLYKLYQISCLLKIDGRESNSLRRPHRPTNLSWFAKDFSGFKTESPAS